MARRSDHSREELTQLFLASARRFAESEGLSGIGARRIARDVGYTAGTIYNLFGSLDGLIVRLRGEALDELYHRSKDTPLDAGPEENLRRLAAAYTDYVLEHPRLWQVVIEHRPPEGSAPEWFREKVLRLMALIEQAIAPLFRPGEEPARLHHARVLWACYHGIISLQMTAEIEARQSTRLLTDSLIENYVFALAHRGDRHPR
jgi:AcrR family transcriptional regulator